MVKNFAIIFLSMVVIALAIFFGKPGAPMVSSAAPANIPADTTTGFFYTVNATDSSLPGYLLFCQSTSTNNEGTLFVMELKSGKITFSKKYDCSVFDFRQWCLNGKTYYTFAIADTTYRNNPSKKYFLPYGSIVIADSAFNEIKRIRYTPADNGTDSEFSGLDIHDIILFSPEHYIVFTGQTRQVNNIPASLHPRPGKEVVACIVQEVNNGKVVWQWDATNFPELYTASEFDNDFTDTAISNYAHMNCMDLDPTDSNLIFSFRNLNQIIKVDRKTGAIKWHLGGKGSDIAMAPGQQFYWQHMPKFAQDGKSILMLDNGNEKTRPYTRVAAVQIDEQHKQLVSYKHWNVPHLYVLKRGNAGFIGNNVLVCGGVSKYIVVFDPATDRYLFEMRANRPIYRAHYALHVPLGTGN